MNANLHFHTLALDGVFSKAHAGALEFHPVPAPSDAEVVEALATVCHRVQRPATRTQLCLRLQRGCGVRGWGVMAWERGRGEGARGRGGC